MPATLVSVLFFARRWRRARIDSPVEYLETRYGPALRQLFAWHGIPVKIVDDSLKIIAIGTFLSVGLGLDLDRSMVASLIITLLYTLLGGLWAVAVTTFIQFIILAAAVLILLPLALANVSGGLSGFLHNSPAGFFHLSSPQYDWKYLTAVTLMYCIGFSSTQWPLIRNYFCVPREKDAWKMGWLVVARSPWSARR